MEVVGDRIYLSSVEIIEPPVKYPAPVDGYDRTPGKGVGHLFVLEKDGTLIEDIVLGEGDMYHPGGLDVDQNGDIWLPGRRVPARQRGHHLQGRPRHLRAQEDVHRRRPRRRGRPRPGDRSAGRPVLGLAPLLRVDDQRASRRRRWLNDSHFVDYQDCEYVASRKALCSGHRRAAGPARRGHGYELGGFALLDLRDPHGSCTRCRRSCGRPPATWSPATPPTSTPSAAHLTMYAAPDDFGEGNDTEILTYEADVTPLR